MSKIKMNVLLAKTDQLAGSYKKGIEEYNKFFKDKQGSFKGERKTYTPAEGKIDVPSERKNDTVVTTVDEKLSYLVDSSSEFINALFAQEATNASGLVKAELVVDGISFGTFSSLELLRLKGLIEAGDLVNMYSNIPVRSDAEIWKETTDEQYQGRKIYESPLQSGTKKTTTKEQYILQDPNISKLGNTASYTPMVSTRDTIEDLGDYTYQKFSGEYSHRERAEILKRRTKLLTAVITAIKEANDVEAISSEMTSDKLFSYLHTGKI
jgi:hypothetical protein